MWARALATLTFSDDLESSTKTAKNMWDLSLAINDNYFYVTGLTQVLFEGSSALLYPVEK